MLRCALAFALILAPTWSACEDDPPRLPIGSTCNANAQCEQGVCGGNQCLDPEIDSDGDGLINWLEAALGTDPTNADTDGDGKPDFAEVGDPDNPTDTDGDGKIDAIESSIEDNDGDCIPDERDPRDNFKDDLETVADLACCCDGTCSVVAPGVPIVADCIPSPPLLIDCARTSDCPLGLACLAQPGRGECTPVDPLLEPVEPGRSCTTDRDCDPGTVCVSLDVSGTCVDSTRSPPIPRPILICALDPMAGDVEAPRLFPDCDE